jgi:hypothetical protein
MLEPDAERLARWRRDDHECLELADRSAAEAAEYLSWEACGLQLIPALNEPCAAQLLADKTSFERIVREAGITVPETLAVLDSEADLITATEMLAAVAPAGVVVKPAASHRGRGVVVFESLEPGGTHGKTVRGRRRSLRSAVDRAASTPGGDQVIIQKALRQHPAMDAYAPHPLSTVRVVTLLRNDGSIRLLGAFLRLGHVDAMTDNTARGGVAVDVDTESGVLGSGVLQDPFRRMDQHPEGRVPFRGRSLPYWDDVLDVCLRAAPLFPAVRLVGWDVMITQAGARLMEANRNIRLRTLQAARGRGLLDGSFLGDLRELGIATERLAVRPGTEADG